MTNLDSPNEPHPKDLEDLLDRARLGRPSDAGERRRVQEHLVGCPICSLQVRNAAFVDQPEYVTAADANLDRVMMNRVLQRLPRSNRRRRFSFSPRWARFAVAMFLVSGTAAAASWWSGRTLLNGRSPNGGAASLSVHGRRAAAVMPEANLEATGEAGPAGAEISPPSAGSAVPVGAGVVVAPTGAQSAAAGAGRSSSRGKVVSAAELFERARALRLAGDFAGARASYRRLQHSFPTSRETQFSYLVLGRMFLDSGKPEQGARQFALYLSNGGGATEEALVGHATALARLGRRNEEAADWQTLLAQHPTSLYAGQARARLREMGNQTP